MSLYLEQLNWMPSPPLVPEDSAIDVQYLGSMTLGEAALEREVLALFAAQSFTLMNQLASLPSDAAAIAHTLKGSARAIGAFRVADAARDFESALKGEGKVGTAMTRLRAAVDEARAEIDRMLGRS